VLFWVPLYKKVLYDAFYPIFNGESNYFFSHIDNFFDLVKERKIDFDFLIQNYKDYVKRRSFKAFREKDPATGAYLSIKEAALKYSFETYMSLFLSHIGAKSYTEVDSGLGKSDLLINYQENEYVIEAKVYRYPLQTQKGLKQLAYYCRSISISEGIYLIFASNQVSVWEIADHLQVNIVELIPSKKSIYSDSQDQTLLKQVQAQTKGNSADKQVVTDFIKSISSDT